MKNKFKKCQKCLKDKPLSSFYKEDYRPFCKACTKESHRIIYKENRRQRYKNISLKNLIPNGFKLCSKCNKIKEVIDFHNQKRGKYGVCSICKQCLKSPLSVIKSLCLNGFKYCVMCKKEKNLSDFHKSKNKLKSWCKKCTNDYNKNNRNINKQLKINKILKHKILNNLRSRMSHALKRNSKNKHTLDYIGCSIEKLKKHLESQFVEGMSWDNYGIKGWHIDHIKPCAKFDLSKTKEQCKCFHYSNLQPLWEKDNLSKQDKF